MATRWGCAIAVATCLGLLVHPTRADEIDAAPSEAIDAETPHDTRALEIAERMADALTGARALRVTMDVAWDAVQEDGQTVEFGATRRVAIRRPDRARMDVVDRSGAERLFVYDGGEIALADETHAVYATAPFTGDLDGMLRYVREELGLPTPLAELLSRDLHERLTAADASAWAGVREIDGVPCDHLAFRNPEVGIQIWVPREGAPLPRRIVLTYETAAGRPQFRASLRDWELAPELDDALFSFTPAEGAERIVFRARGELLPPVSSLEGRP